MKCHGAHIQRFSAIKEALLSAGLVVEQQIQIILTLLKCQAKSRFIFKCVERIDIALFNNPLIHRKRMLSFGELIGRRPLTAEIKSV